jgi:hypothetical protein
MDFQTENNQRGMYDSVFSSGHTIGEYSMSAEVSTVYSVRNTITWAVWAPSVDCLQSSVANAVASECKEIVKYEKYIQIN